MVFKTNPYVAGNPVGGGDAFIGRSDVLRAVERVLRSPGENAVVLYGQRRIGKTSVLQELSAGLPKKGDYAPIYFDLQDKAALPLDRVLRELAERILINLDISPTDDLQDNDDFSTSFQKDFLPYILSRLSKETALVLLFDEFDVMDNPTGKQAGSALFPYLRDLMAVDRRRLKFVFVIGRRPEDLSNLSLSLFKGIKSRHVSLMSPEDTAELACLSERDDSLKWPDDAAARVHSLTGGHAYLAQQLCWVIWESVYDEEPEETPAVRADDVEAAVPEALDSAKSSLEWLWDGLGPAERVVASALAGAGPRVITQEELEKRLQESGVRILIGELQDAPRVLEEWDLIQPEDGGYRIRVEMLRLWIVQRKPLSRVQDELDRVLPMADNLFQAAYGYYQKSDLENATLLLRQAVSLNPNHLKANQLLAEILLAEGKTDEALKFLETLYEYNPTAARPRLVQALLRQAEKEDQEDEKLAVYEKILELDPRQPETVADYRRIWEKRGNTALKSNDMDEALGAYKKAYESDSEKFLSRFIRVLLSQAKEKELDDEKLTFYEKVLELESEQSEALAEYQRLWEKQGDAAYENNELDKALEAYEKADTKEKTERVNKKFQLENLYQQAVDALKKNEREKAQELLLEVTSVEPSFKEAAYYLYLAVTGRKSESKLKKGLKFLFVIISICAIFTVAIVTPIFLDYWTASFERQKTISALKDQVKAQKKTIDEYLAKIGDQEKMIREYSVKIEAQKKTIDEYLVKIEVQEKTVREYSSKIEAQEKIIIAYYEDKKTVSSEEFIKVFRLNKNRRPLEYVKNNFEDNGNTVTDRNTGLIWQKSGSDSMNYKEVQEYVEKLNRTHFAGYNNWRLPTIKELMTLIEPEKQSKGLYIDPIFDEKQRWCWSSDKQESGGAWAVDFGYGLVSRGFNSYYVRVVRP